MKLNLNKKYLGAVIGVAALLSAAYIHAETKAPAYTGTLIHFSLTANSSKSDLSGKTVYFNTVPSFGITNPVTINGTRVLDSMAGSNLKSIVMERVDNAPVPAPYAIPDYISQCAKTAKDTNTAVSFDLNYNVDTKAWTLSNLSMPSGCPK